MQESIIVICAVLLTMSLDAGRLQVISVIYREIDAPMLSALVINKDENMPGKGFFTLYAELNGIARVKDEDKLKIWIDEYHKVINYREWDKLLSYLGIAT